jgi:hypothetical protein
VWAVIALGVYFVSNLGDPKFVTVKRSRSLHAIELDHFGFLLRIAVALRPLEYGSNFGIKSAALGHLRRARQ